jgi:hypothetical protein
MRYLFVVVCLIWSFSLHAQVEKKAQLEQQKKDNLAKIKELN